MSRQQLTEEKKRLVRLIVGLPQSITKKRTPLKRRPTAVRVVELDQYRDHEMLPSLIRHGSTERTPLIKAGVTHSRPPEHG
jgi:hypothetical protein